MGLFGFNYSKPGPGIDKNAPKKKGIFRYFEIFFRKFWKLIQVNMLSFVISIPFLAVMFFISPTDSVITAFLGELDNSSLMLSLTLRGLFAVTMYILWGSGPASAAYAYITRCFTREQHAWILSDFKDKFLENFKQGIIVSVIDIIVMLAFIFGFNTYYTQYLSAGSGLWFIMLGVYAMITLLYTFMHFYIYQFMITFESTTIGLYRNAFIFSVAQMPMCIILAIVAIAVNVLLFYFLNPMVALILSFVIVASLARFPIEYSAARAIEKKLLANIEDTDERGEGEE